MVKHVAGAPAPKVGKWEEIGPAECPIVYRRTLISCRLGKLLVHRFVPGASDKDPHDHPASFLTVVLRGGYTDISREPAGEHIFDQVRSPAIRFRPAEHAHVTRVDADGALTVVVMGPKRRDCGFWRDSRWWPWRRYEERYGLNFRCEDDG